MPIAPYINISKLDAAKRQLETAIKLFLTHSDPISIHTLSAAAHEVLSKLIEGQNLGSSFMEEGIEKFIKKEKQQEVRKKLKEAQNFFKHAAKDPDEVYKFHFKSTEFFLWDTCRMYQTISKEIPPLIWVFNAWFYSTYPDYILDEKQRSLWTNFQAEFKLNPENRTQFLDLLPYVIRLSRYS